MKEPLLERWRQGDDLAGQTLVGMHFESIYRFFLNKAPGHVEDLTQETFTRCVGAVDRFEGYSSLRTFLFGIARRVLYEHYRRRNAANAREVNFGVTSAADLEPTATQRLAADGERADLLAALRGLPVDLQVALELFYWEELSVGEIAEALSIPTGTVKRRLQRGRQALQGTLQQRWRAMDR